MLRYPNAVRLYVGFRYKLSAGLGDTTSCMRMRKILLISKTSALRMAGQTERKDC